MTNYIVAALHPKDVSQGCFIFIWYFLQHIIRRIQYDYFIPYCIFSYNLIVRPFFPWPACNTHNSISGHTHYYFFSLYSVLHLITFVERSALLYLGAGIQFLYGIYALSKTLFGGYHNLRQMILAVGWTNIFYIPTIFIINMCYNRYKKMKSLDYIVLFFIIANCINFDLYYFVYPDTLKI